MKKLLLLARVILACFPLLSQSGTSGSPFTQLGNAWHVPSSGIYHFSIGGTSFSTYVEAGSGWILVASGNKSTSESAYSITSNLTLQSDAVLPAAAYASATINAVRINTSSGPTSFDVQTTNSTVISNLRSNKTLSVSAGSATWTGTGTSRMGPTCGSTESTLAERIYHAGCVGNGLHWLMPSGWEYADLGTQPSKDDLNLWMRAASVAPLPVGWSFVETGLQPDLSRRVSWGTEFEVNNDFFSVERSADAQAWEEIVRIQGNNQAEPQTYSATDTDPATGKVYYRIRQTDFDGLTTVSEVREVLVPDARLTTLKLFPNPAQNHVSFAADRVPTQWQVLSLHGQDFSARVQLSESRRGMVQMDVSVLPRGWYFMVADGDSEVFMKE